MASTPARWTAAQVRELPDDGRRYEVIDGALFVTPAPSWRHQDAAFQLGSILQSYVRSTSIGHTIIAPADVEFAADRMVEPDIFVVPLVNGQKPSTWSDVERLLLAVEILSPSSARADREVKRRLYQRERVPEYWIVDVDARVIERWRPDDERPEILSTSLTWQPDNRNAALDIDLDRYFRDVCDA